MKFRPRYSLLTLLVLTALVAGGVRWWRGPHRSVVSDPPIARERELLARASHSESMAVRYEYIYLNGGREPEYLALIGYPPMAVNMFVEERVNQERTKLEAWPVDPLEKPISSQLKFQKKLIARVVYSGKSLRQPPSTQQIDEGTPLFEDCYLLTSDGMIYEIASIEHTSLVNQVELSEILDPTAREMLALVQTELSNETK